MADSMAFSIEKSMEEMKDKINDSDKEEIKTIISKLKKATTEKNVSEIETYQKELEEKWGPIVQKVYQTQQTSENTASHNETKADDIEGTDFEEVK